MKRPRLCFFLLAVAIAAARAEPLVPAGGGAALADETRTITLRELPLLFTDDSGVASSSGVKRTMHVARTRPKPVLGGELPQEGSRVYLTGSVYFDEATGLLRMWYAGHPDLPGGKKPKVEGFRSGRGEISCSMPRRRMASPGIGRHLACMNSQAPNRRTSSPTSTAQSDTVRRGRPRTVIDSPVTGVLGG
jgi:hypothetical protein